MRVDACVCLVPVSLTLSVAVSSVVLCALVRLFFLNSFFFRFLFLSFLSSFQHCSSSFFCFCRLRHPLYKLSIAGGGVFVQAQHLTMVSAALARRYLLVGHVTGDVVSCHPSTLKRPGSRLQTHSCPENPVCRSEIYSRWHSNKADIRTMVHQPFSQSSLRGGLVMENYSHVVF